MSEWPTAHGALVDALASDVVDRIDAGEDAEDALWDAVSAYVPELSPDRCETLLASSSTEPMDDLVEQVASDRGSDADERQRAAAFTALLQDVNVEVAARGGYEERPDLG